MGGGYIRTVAATRQSFVRSSPRSRVAPARGSRRAAELGGGDGGRDGEAEAGTPGALLPRPATWPGYQQSTVSVVIEPAHSARDRGQPKLIHQGHRFAFDAPPMHPPPGVRRGTPWQSAGFPHEAWDRSGRDYLSHPQASRWSQPTELPNRSLRPHAGVFGGELASCSAGDCSERDS